MSNPPYISPREANELPALVRDWEPAIALFADEDGMAAIAELVHGAAALLNASGVLVLEVTFDVVDGKEKLLQNRGPEEIRTIVARLRERNAPGDAAAIEAIIEANPAAFGPTAT